MDTTAINLSDLPDPLEDGTWSECESRIKAFERAWLQRTAPVIDDYLTAEAPWRAALLLELVHIDLELRVKSGDSARVESYISRYPELAKNPDVVLDLVVNEYELRLRREDHLVVEEYRQRFPEFADELALRLASIDRAAAASLVFQRALPPPVVPGYEIIEEIGRGGMGVVYKARDSALDRFVALKFLPAELAGDQLLLQRFVREAQTASALNHPHICTVHALGEHDGRHFIVLEFIEGQTLNTLSDDVSELTSLSNLIRQVAAALVAAHTAGVVHRDIKPENIMVRSDGYVKVLDFGLARRLPSIDCSTSPASRETWPGAIIGTVAYMSPEQARGEPLDAASDVFSLGVLLYLLTTGKHPFERGSAFDTMHAIGNHDPVLPSRLNPAIPAALDRLIEAMLHKQSQLRPTMTDVELALADPLLYRRSVIESHTRRIVLRERELSRLRDAFTMAECGCGSVICIAGEPGIGKTTLVEAFLEQLTNSDACIVARGHCSERQAAASAYLPFIDALADLLRSEKRGAVSRLMPIVAPTWSTQLGLSASAPVDSPPILALSQQAMLREFLQLIAEVSRLSPVVLFIDDVHWADLSTVDLLAYLGRHGQSLRVLLIATYRPTELLLGPHPFHRVKLDLQGQGICNEISIGFLSRQEIDHYLTLAFPGHVFPKNFAHLIHSRTEGSPLFMVDLLRYLRERDVIARSDKGWTIARELPDVWHELPESVRSMVQRKLERLEQDDRVLLSAAAAQGYEFDSTSIAAALGRDPAAVEERLQVLDRVHGLVRLLREDEFPDRVLTLRYAFVHVLYQQALFADLPPTRRALISKALAQSLDCHYGPQSSNVAAELACLYEVGRDLIRAARHYQQAAQNAARVFAHRNAIDLAQRGLDLLRGLPSSTERDALELLLQTTLGLQLQVTEGYAAKSAEQAYERARALCTSSAGDLFPIVWGLWLVRKVRSELPRANQLAIELMSLACQQQSLDLALQAHQALGLTALCRGQPTISVEHTEQVAALYHPDLHRAHAFMFGQDPGVICKAYGAIALWLLGYPEAAQRQVEQAIAMSLGLSPNTQSVALHFASMVFQLCGDESRTRHYADASVANAAEHGFAFWLAGGTLLGGWAVAASGESASGIDQLRRGLRDWQATGSGTYVTYYLGLLADALYRDGNFDESRRVIDEALDLVKESDERLFAPELYRLRGELCLRDASGPSSAWSRAEHDFRTALEIAERQDAKSMTLRAAISLARLQQSRGAAHDAAQLLADSYSVFTEGFQTRDLQDARSLLDVLIQ